MSDEPIKLAEGMTPIARQRVTVLGHICEHAGCGKVAGWGFGRPPKPQLWFCFKRRADGEQYI